VRADVYRLIVSDEHFAAALRDLSEVAEPEVLLRRSDDEGGELVEIEVWGNTTLPWPLLLITRRTAERRLRRLAQRYRMVVLRTRPRVIHLPSD
jgi:hypothetical protein